MNVSFKKLRIRFMLYISQELDKHPSLKQKIFRFRYWIWRLKLRMSSGGIDKVACLDKTFWVNPDKIIYSLRKGFNIYKDNGRVISGDWDLPDNRIPFEHLDVYQAFCQRFLNHKTVLDDH